MDVFSSTQKSSLIPSTLLSFLIAFLTFGEASPIICNAQESTSIASAIPPLPSPKEHLRLAALLGPHAYLPAINPSQARLTRKMSRGSITEQVAVGFRLLRESQIWWVINAEPSELVESSPSDQMLVLANEHTTPESAKQTDRNTAAFVPDTPAISPLPIQMIAGNSVDEHTNSQDRIRLKTQINSDHGKDLIGSGPIVVFIEEPYLAYDLIKVDLAENEGTFLKGRQRNAKSDLAINAIRLHAPKPLASKILIAETMTYESPTGANETAIPTTDIASTPPAVASSVATSSSKGGATRPSEVRDSTNSHEVWDDFDRLIAPEPATTIANVRTISGSDTNQYKFTKQPQSHTISFASRQLGQVLITLGKIESFAQQQIRSEMSSQWQAFQRRWEEKRIETRKVQKAWTPPSDAGLALLLRAGASAPNLPPTGREVNRDDLNNKIGTTARATGRAPEAVAMKPLLEKSTGPETR